MPPFLRDDKPARWFQDIQDIQELQEAADELPHQLVNMDIEMELNALSATVQHMRVEQARMQQMLDEIQLRIRRSEHLNEIQRLIDARDALASQQPPTEESVREQSALDEQIDAMMNEYP